MVAGARTKKCAAHGTTVQNPKGRGVTKEFPWPKGA